MAEVAALATPSIRRQIGNKGRIAEQGALTWVLHSQSGKWKDRVMLERNFTMNGNWMDYAGKWVKGEKRLNQAVWGNDQVPPHRQRIHAANASMPPPPRRQRIHSAATAPRSRRRRRHMAPRPLRGASPPFALYRAAAHPASAAAAPASAAPLPARRVRWQVPFVVQYAGCQMCRGHSENGTWHDQGVKKCHSAFLEAYTFGDDQVLHALGLRHLSMETHLVRANAGSELYQRHQRMTRCLPQFLVIGTRAGSGAARAGGGAARAPNEPPTSPQ